MRSVSMPTARSHCHWVNGATALLPLTGQNWKNCLGLGRKLSGGASVHCSAPIEELGYAVTAHKGAKEVIWLPVCCCDSSLKFPSFLYRCHAVTVIGAYRYSCGACLPSNLLREHEERECPKRPVTCTIGCGAVLWASELKHHETSECPVRQVSCGCPAQSLHSREKEG